MDLAKPRFRYTLRGALIAIFFIALILGGVEYVRREKRLTQLAHAELAHQRNVTEATLAQAHQELIPPGTMLQSSGTGSSSSYMDWGEQMVMIESSGDTLIELEIRGRMVGSELLPIRITAKGDWKPEILRRLAKEYDKRKWRYDVGTTPADTQVAAPSPTIE
jgi:hypothetical protein